MNNNQNNNQNNNPNNNPKNDDLNDYFSQQKKELIRQQLLSKSRKKREAILSRLNFLKDCKKKALQFRDYGAKFLHPNTVVSIVLLFTLLRSLRYNELEARVKEQEALIEKQRVELLVRRQKTDVLGFLKNNWRPFFVIGSTVLFPIGKHFYEYNRTTKQLERTTQKLATAEKETIEVKKQSEADLNEAKKQSEADLKQLKDETDLKISKLHVTLNRLNDAALASAQRETEMRSKIVECQKELAEAIETRDRIQEELVEVQNLCEKQIEELSQNKIELNVIQQEIKAKEDQQSQLQFELKTAQKDSLFWRGKVRKLQNRLQAADKERKMLYREKEDIEKFIRQSQFENKALKSRAQSQEKQFDRLQNQTKMLKEENEKNAIQLQKAVDKTNRYALQMDQAKSDLESLNQSWKNNSLLQNSKIQSLEKRVADKDELLLKKQQQITQLDNQNQRLEQSIEDTKRQVNQVVIAREELKGQLLREQKMLEEASGKEKTNLKKQVRKKTKTIEVLKKEHRNLKESLQKQGKELTKSYLHQEELINDLSKSNQLQENYFQQLQFERAQEERKHNMLMNRHNTLLNDLLDQQEKDQSQPWWKKFVQSVNIYPSIAITKKTEGQQKRFINNSLFFPGSFMPKVQTIEDPETGKSEVITPIRI